MSIKIYDGLKIKADSLEDAISLINQKKSNIKELIKESELKAEFYGSLNILITYLIESEDILKNHFDIDIYTEKKAISGKSSALFEIENASKADKEEQQCNVIIFPEKMQIDNSSHYLAFLYSPRFLDKQIGAEMSDILTEYGYWDNSDIPEDISDEEWSQREKNWNKALLSKSAIPIEDGISIQLGANNHYILQSDKMLSLENNCKKLEDFSFCYSDKAVDMLSHLLTLKTTRKSLDDAYLLRGDIKSGNLTKTQKELVDKFYKVLYQTIPEEIKLEYLTKPLLDVKKDLDKLKLSLRLEEKLTSKSNKIKPKI